MYHNFLNILHEAFNNFIPLKNQNENKYSPWYNNRLFNVKNRKTKAYKQCRNDPYNEVNQIAYVNI